MNFLKPLIPVCMAAFLVLSCAGADIYGEIDPAIEAAAFSQADIAPARGSAEKPVGTVWFAAAHRDGVMRLRHGFYPGRNRRQTQERAVVSALGMQIVALRHEEAKKTIDF